MSVAGTSLVDADTGEIIVTCTPERARDLTDKIQTSLHVAWELVKEAYQTRAWAALGYRSWDHYTREEFGANRLRLPREERQEVVGSLRDAGMSVRAIAAATQSSPNTVQKDLRQVSQSDTPAEPDDEPAPEPKPVTGLDGKRYQPKPSGAPPAPKRRDLTDQFFDAAHDLTKKVEAVHRLTEDDRFTANAEKVAAKHRNDLLEARDLLQEVIDRLPKDNR